MWLIVKKKTNADTLPFEKFGVGKIFLKKFMVTI